MTAVQTKTMQSLFPTEKTLVASDGKTYMSYVESACMVSGFGHLSSWDVLYRPTESKKMTRCGLPLMFPNFSFVKDDTFTECGTKLPKHGIFCREFADTKMEWTKVAETANSVTMAADSNDYSMKMFPFKFRLECTFTVLPNKLVHHFVIKNLEDSKMLPASPGLHPYFSVPLEDKQKVTTNCSGLDFACSAWDWKDNCPDNNYPFSGKLEIGIPNKGKVTMTDKSGLYKRIQIWADKPSSTDYNFICFEPVVLGGDGLNNKEERLNIAPGSSAVLDLEIEIEPTN